MALTDEGNGNGFYMPVAPAYGGGYNNNGGFGMGGDWAWIILLLLAFGGGWGMGGFGMGGMMWPMMMGGMGSFGIDYLYPWLNNSEHISDGFRDQQLNNQVSDLRTDVNRGFGDVQLGIAGVNQNICQTGNGIVNALNSGFNSAEIAANSRQIANMQQAYAAQTANMQGFNALQAQAADCCCKTQTGIADLRYTVATENCADRAALAEGIRDIIAANNAGIQSIKDQLCQDKIDAKNDTIAQLRSELLYARGQASQDVQTARILAGQTSEADAIYNRLSQCPVGTVPVYGNTPIWTCTQNVANGYNGCGCGCNG